MTTYKQREQFVDSMIPSSLLQDAIDWISTYLSPEEVFSTDQLDEWALENDFMRLVTTQDEI